MATVTQSISVRDCARALVDLDAPTEGGPGFDAFVERAIPLAQALLAKPDLLVSPFATSTHRVETRLLYCDQQLTIIAGREPLSRVPIHDHGMWEMLGLYRGRLDHAMYERLDDGGTPGRAEIREIDSRILEPGDVVVVPPPPHDLHGFNALTEDTWLVAFLPGWYKPVRRYFDVESQSYYEFANTPV